MGMNSSELLKQILPLLIPEIEGMIQGASVGGAVPSPHDLNSAHHSGLLADSQAPQFLKLDGSRSLTGNLAVAAGITIDGIDLSAMAAGTVSASSSNSPNLSGSHIHAVTASSSPGATASLLKTDASGFLTLEKITSTTAPTFSSLTANGGVLYTNASGVVSQDNLIVVDATNNRIGVGTASPTGTFHALSSTNGSYLGVRIDNQNAGTSTAAIIRFLAGAGADLVSGDVQALPKNYTNAGVADSVALVTPTAAHIDLRSLLATGDVRFFVGTAATPMYTFLVGSANFKQALAVADSTGSVTPQAALHAIGSLILDTATPLVMTGSASGELGRYVQITNSSATQTPAGLKAGGVLVSDDFAYASPGKNDLIVKGKGAFGIASSTAQVDILSATEQLRLRYNATTYASLTVDSAGTLTWATTAAAPLNANLDLKPGGSITLTPSPSLSTGDVLPNANYRVNMGSITKKFLTLHAAELWIETLVAQETIATIGGRVLVGPTTTLTRDLTSVATTIFVKHNQMRLGDRVYLEADGKIEFMAIASSPATITANAEYSYSVTRNLDGTGANAWVAGDAIFNTGQAGNGFIDLYSLAGVNSPPLDYIFNYNNNATAAPYESGVYSQNYNLTTTWTYFGDNSGNEVGDAVYFGVANTTWQNLYNFVTTAGNFSVTRVWEYWDGTNWTAFTVTQTGTLGAVGEFGIAWDKTLLTGWVAKTINGVSAFWVRNRISAFTSLTTRPIVGRRRTYYSQQNFGPAIVMNVRNSNTFNDWSEHAAFGNLRGTYGYGADAYGVAFGKYSTSAGTTYVTIDATNGYRILNGSTIIGQWDQSGVLTLGKTGGSEPNLTLDSTNGFRVRLGTGTVLASWAITGNITVGQSASSHVLISSGSLAIRNGANDKITLDSSGNLTMVGVLSLGSAGGVYQGTGSFASPTTGLKLWNDSGIGRIGGYNSGTLQWYGGTDGKLWAGSGSVVLENSGITVLPGSGTNVLQFKDAADTYALGYLRAFRGATAANDVMYIVANNRSGTRPQSISFSDTGITIASETVPTYYTFGGLAFDCGGVGNFSAAGLRMKVQASIPSGGSSGDSVVYESGATRRLYINVNGTWRYVDLT